MQKILLILLIIIFQGSLVSDQTITGASSNGLQYEMVSYTSNNRSADTPFINLNFLNNGIFTINYQSFSNAFQFIFDLVIGTSIATAVVVFMIGAFEGIISGTSANEKKKGKDRMQNAIIGLIVILSTWLIINTINPDLLRLPLFTSLDKISTNGSNTGAPGTTVTPTSACPGGAAC